MRINAVVALRYRMLTPVAWPMQMPGKKARQGADASEGDKSWRLRNEQSPASGHFRAWHHADAGLGIELLSARDPGRSDRARPRHVRQLDLCRLLGGAGDLGAARPPHRPADRPVWRPAGIVHLQPHDCGGFGTAWYHRLDSAADPRLDPARHRHGMRPLRCRFRCARTHLWPRRARADHRHHADGRLCFAPSDGR